MFTSTQEVADFISEQNIELVDVASATSPGFSSTLRSP